MNFQFSPPAGGFNFQKKEKGFTLIELLIVVSILAILITLGYQSFTGSQKKARDAQRKSDLRQIQKALELYQQDQPTPQYPDATTWADLETELETNDYMKEVPADPLPSAGNWPAYSYNRDSDSLKYTLYACLENLNDPSRDDVDGGANDRCVDKGVSLTITEP